MFAQRDREIGELLRHRGLVSVERCRTLEAEAHAAGVSLAAHLIESEFLSRSRLLTIVAEELGHEFVEIPPQRLSPEIAALLPGVLARVHRIVPWRDAEGVLELLLLDPFAGVDLGELEFALGRRVRVSVGDPQVVAALLREHYDGAGAIATGELALSAIPTGNSAALGNLDELAAQAGQPPVVKYVDELLERAVREQASDLHFEPFEQSCRVRSRIDGALREWPPPPAEYAPAVASRLKVLANLDIAERRVPQDGRIQFAPGGRAVDLRVSTLPTQFGESIVLRVLDGKRCAGVSLDALAMPAAVLSSMRAAIRRPSGIIVVTGPTGSGKTTTLYACLREINASGAKLLTVEDPVEYELDGVMQVAVNPTAGLSFATALRSFLRQDPDVVMVGEIRDLETAHVAIQAALTGHLVLTTLHTNDAAGAVTRLVDLGVEPYLVAASLEVVLAQRLVRCICPECRCEQVPPAGVRERLAGGSGEVVGGRFYVGAGCSACQGSGYRGRAGLFELLTVDDMMRERIARGCGTQEIRDLALARGLQPLRAAGLAAVAAGVTTCEEVLRYT
ncbi:MAG TPA: GspE/PulE family protein [Opitutaceae bacterium]|nr:GspE/PulE family protein [Opitutaceae bacterium]